MRPGAWEGPVEERGAGGWRRVVGGGRRAAGRLGRPVVGRNGRDRVEDLVEADESSGKERGIAGWVRSIMSGATQCRPPSSGGRASSALRRDPELVTPTRSGSLMMKARDPLEESEALEEREELEELLYASVRYSASFMQSLTFPLQSWHSKGLEGSLRCAG